MIDNGESKDRPESQGDSGSGGTAGHNDTVAIIVDDRAHHVRKGLWIVSDLKKEVGVDAAKVLAEITPQVLKDLADDASIEVHEGQRFMSHVRSGGSS